MSEIQARPQISVVAPLWNEEDNVRPLAQQVFAAFGGGLPAIELILVDDASTDKTWERILEAQAADKRIRAVRHSRNSGQSAALWTGFQVSRGDIIATLDGDLQNDPADLPRLLEALQSADLVCGVRTKRMDSAVRKISSKIARWARKAALGVDFRDSGCNLRVFKRSVLQSLFAFDGLHRFMPIIAHGGGNVVIEVPVNHRPRIAGVSKYGIWNRLGRGICDLAMIAWYKKRQLKNIGFTEHETRSR
ncbi:MAG TPA: glycosyltransferase family 2 protein [Verrucomicrobiae bacterium]|nr:glycosyltransferase family 2 protein [Verrucomicrobiae bacterium]